MVAGSENIAYLDGELEPEVHDAVQRMLGADTSLRTRLAAIAEGTRPVRSAYNALLKSAPQDRLQALANALAIRPSAGSNDFVVRCWLRPQSSSCCSAAVLPAISAVAGEISLYDEASMAAIEFDHTALKAELNKLGQELKLDLSEANVTP